MVLLGRIELPTSALPRMRSTTELRQHAKRQQAVATDGRAYGLAPLPMSTDRWAMGRPDQQREDRLAAALRDNLRRRKAQTREMDAQPNSEPSQPDTE